MTSVAYEMYIPLTSEGDIDISFARYCRYGLDEKITDEALKTALYKGTFTFVETLLEKIKGNPYKLNYANIIEKTDMESVLKNSENVFFVEIVKTMQSPSGPQNYFCERRCIRVISVLKGDCENGELYSVILPVNIKDGKYIIAVQNRVGGGFSLLFGRDSAEFVISSKNSIYKVEEEENIKAVLAELEK